MALIEGIHSGIDIEVYHASEGISSSGMNKILDCPARYYHHYIAKNLDAYEAEEATKEKQKYVLGSALHCLLLEPHLFDIQFHSLDRKLNLRTKVDKEFLKDIHIIYPTKKILTLSETKHLYGMYESAKKHPLWAKIKNGKREQSIFWQDGIYKTQLRTRPDIYDDMYIVDLKTTRSIKGFKRSILDYGYHRQAALQIDGLEKFTGRRRFFGFFAIESMPPYLSKTFTLSQRYLDLGRREYLDAAALYSECLLYNNWPGYDVTFDTIDAPEWAVGERL